MTDKRPLLYVAGPYTRPDPVENTHRVIKVAEAIYDAGDWVPVIPHLTMLWHLVSPHDVDYWYAYDLHVMRRCNAVVRLPGPSSGADREILEAFTIRMPRIQFRELPAAAQDLWINSPLGGTVE